MYHAHGSTFKDDSSEHCRGRGVTTDRFTAVNLGLGAFQKRSVVNGPGTRAVLWVQGCPLKCPGCINEEFWDERPRTVVTVTALADRILGISGIEGVTYTGGEPMAQAGALAMLSQRLHAAGLTVVCYTGYTLENLVERNEPGIDELLSCVDILIDGPYVREQATNLRWRGSRNQRVHFLSQRYQHLAPAVAQEVAEVEMVLGRNHLTTTGNWPPGFLERLEQILRS